MSQTHTQEHDQLIAALDRIAAAMEQQVRFLQWMGESQLRLLDALVGEEEPDSSSPERYLDGSLAQ